MDEPLICKRVNIRPHGIRLFGVDLYPVEYEGAARVFLDGNEMRYEPTGPLTRTVPSLRIRLAWYLVGLPIWWLTPYWEWIKDWRF